MLFKKKKNTKSGTTTWTESGQSGDERLPGNAGYRGVGLKKNAMPENRFNFRRPDDKQR